MSSDQAERDHLALILDMMLCLTALDMAPPRLTTVPPPPTRRDFIVLRARGRVVGVEERVA